MAQAERIPPVEPDQSTVSGNEGPADLRLPGSAGALVPAPRTPSSDCGFSRLTREEALSLVQAAGVTAEGIKHLVECRRAPSRNVKGGGGNKRGEFFSQKNGYPVQYESFNCEWVFAQLLEADARVVWYGCQPPPVPCAYVGPDGRRQRRQFRNDYLYLLDDGSLHEVECKLAADVEKKLAEEAHLYARDEASGVVHCPPVRQALEAMGIRHRVAVPDATDRLFARNAVYLQGYRRPPLPAATTSQFREALRDGPLPALVLADRTTQDIDDVLKAVAQGCVYMDLRHFPAWETETMLVHLSRDSMSAFVHLADRATVVCDVVPPLGPGARGTWDGRPYTVAHLGDTRVFLRCGDDAGEPVVDMPVADFDRLVREGAIVPATREVHVHPVNRQLHRYGQLTDKERGRAVERVEEVRAVRSGRRTVAEAADRLGVSPRQVYRYIRLYAGDDPRDPDGGFVALAPKSRNSGLRGCQLAPDVQDRLDKWIEEQFFRKGKATLPRPTVAGAYRQYPDDVGAEAASKGTFSKRVKGLTNVQNAAARDGRRVANRHRVQRGRDPDEAVFPFQQLQIDGTPGDLLLALFADASGECWFQRPTITAIYDCSSAACVGFSCLFGAESSVTAMMAVRNTVERHGRLPAVLFADNAGAHTSDVVRNLIVGLGAGDLRFRPSGRPEFGGQVEQLIKACTQELLSHLAGYTERLKAVRTLTGTHDPRRDVVWSLEALTRFLEFFFFEFYNRRMHPGVAAIPEQRLQEGFALRGARETQRVTYNDAFVVATMPTAPGERILSREKGVFLHSVRYRNPELCAQLPGDTRLGKRTVRWDPSDISRIFVPVHGRFAPFTSIHADVLSRYSVGEAQALSRAWPARMAEARRARAGEDSPMARFLARVHEEQEARKARVRTQSNRQAASATSSRARHAEASSTPQKTGTGPADRWSRFRVGSQASGLDGDGGA